ncbi:uncharacterized protein [Apostichopus japonicus]|uniref:uncharacterized protein n=1 Tax=Stichopus japonicus TaxID=307972 RepID=UPI003AB353E1
MEMCILPECQMTGNPNTADMCEGCFKAHMDMEKEYGRGTRHQEDDGFVMVNNQREEDRIPRRVDSSERVQSDIINRREALLNKLGMEFQREEDRIPRRVDSSERVQSDIINRREAMLNKLGMEDRPDSQPRQSPPERRQDAPPQQMLPQQMQSQQMLSQQMRSAPVPSRVPVVTVKKDLCATPGCHVVRLKNTDLCRACKEDKKGSTERPRDTPVVRSEPQRQLHTPYQREEDRIPRRVDSSERVQSDIINRREAMLNKLGMEDRPDSQPRQSAPERRQDAPPQQMLPQQKQSQQMLSQQMRSAPVPFRVPVVTVKKDLCATPGCHVVRLKNTDLCRACKEDKKGSTKRPRDTPVVRSEPQRQPHTPFQREEDRIPRRVDSSERVQSDIINRREAMLNKLGMEDRPDSQPRQSAPERRQDAPPQQMLPQQKQSQQMLSQQMRSAPVPFRVPVVTVKKDLCATPGCHVVRLKNTDLCRACKEDKKGSTKRPRDTPVVRSEPQRQPHTPFQREEDRIPRRVDSSERVQSDIINRREAMLNKLGMEDRPDSQPRQSPPERRQDAPPQQMLPQQMQSQQMLSQQMRSAPVPSRVPVVTVKKDLCATPGCHVVRLKNTDLCRACKEDKKGSTERPRDTPVVRSEPQRQLHTPYQREEDRIPRRVDSSERVQSDIINRREAMLNKLGMEDRPDSQPRQSPPERRQDAPPQQMLPQQKQSQQMLSQQMRSAPVPSRVPVVTVKKDLCATPGCHVVRLKNTDLCRACKEDKKGSTERPRDTPVVRSEPQRQPHTPYQKPPRKCKIRKCEQSAAPDFKYCLECLEDIEPQYQMSSGSGLPMATPPVAAPELPYRPQNYGQQYQTRTAPNQTLSGPGGPVHRNRNLSNQSSASSGGRGEVNINSYSPLPKKMEDKALKSTNEHLDQQLRDLESQEIEKLREKNLCTICLDNDVEVLFLPCKHLITCADCATRIDTCPICRTEIDDKMHVYMP